MLPPPPALPVVSRPPNPEKVACPVVSRVAVGVGAVVGGGLLV